MLIYIIKNKYTNKTYYLFGDYQDYLEAIEKEGLDINHWELISITEEI